MEEHVIISENKSLEIYKNNIVTNIINLKNGKELISFFEKSIEKDIYYSKDI